MNKNVSRRAFPQRPSPGRHGFPWTLIQAVVAVSIRNPRLTMLPLLLAVLAAAPGMFFLELRTDGQALKPANDPRILFDAQVRSHFDLRDPIAITIDTRSPEGIFNLPTLRIVSELSEKLAGLDGIGFDHVVSLATERRDRVYPGTLDFRFFLDPLPTTPELMEQLRQDLAAADIMTGTLVTRDRNSTAILIGVPNTEERSQNIDRTGLYRTVSALARQYQTEADRIRVVGAPVAEALLGVHVLEDLAVLLPLAVLAIGLVLWVGCRRIWGVLLGMAEVGACLVFTFGVMGWTGVPLFLTTAVLPVILVTIGLADEIHILWHHQRELALDRSTADHEAVRTTMGAMMRPIVLTSVTTSIGFLSFLTSPLEAVRVFGWFAPLGILFCMVWSLTAMPAALAFLGPARLRRRRRERPSAGWNATAWAVPILKRPVRTLVVLAVMTAILGSGAVALSVQDSWLDGFSPTSPFRRATDLVNSQYHGTHLLLVHLSAPEPDEAAQRVGYGEYGPLLEPDLLGKIGDFEAYLRGLPGVGGVVGPYSQLTTVSYLRHARREVMRAIPPNPREVAKLLRRFDQSRGVQRRSEIIDDARRQAIVTIFLKNANYRETDRLMERIRDYGDEHLEPSGLVIGFAGDVGVSQAMIPVIVRSQLLSLFMALAGACLALWLLTRRLSAAFALLLPTCVAVLWTFGGMGWLGIPLGVATSMFCAITLGIGVDYSIHLYESYLRACARNEGSSTGRGGAALAAVLDTGPAILADTAAIAIGFGLLVVSQVPANARLGMLVAAALAANCLLTLGGLGCWLTLRNRVSDSENEILMDRGTEAAV